MSDLHDLLNHALATCTTGELVKEVQKRIPCKITNILIKQNKIRVQHNYHLDNLATADDVDRALAAHL